MTRQQIFPTILIVLDIAACLMYCYPMEWRKAVYWGAAAALTYTVVW